MRARGWDVAVAIALALLAAGWTAFVAAAAIDRLPRHIPATGLLAAAVGLAAAAGTSRWRDRADVRWTVAWILLVPAAVVAAHLVSNHPSAIVACPVVLATGLLARRAPAANLVGVLVITGFYGTLTAYTSLPLGKLIDALLVGVCAALAWELLIAGRSDRFALPPGVVCLLGLGLVSLAHIVAAPDPALALRAVRSSTFFALMIVAVALVARDRRTAATIGRAILVIAIAVAAYGVLRYVTGPTHKELVLAEQQPFNRNNGALRLIGSLLSRHQLAVWLGGVVPFCVAFAAASGRRAQVATAVLGVLSAIAVLATNSRGGLLAAIVGMAAVVLLLNAAPAFPAFRMGTSATLALVVVVAGALAMTLTLTPSDRRHFENILHPGRDVAYQARQVKWREAEHSIWRHPWGLGPGSASGLSLSARDANNVGARDIDNSYLTLAYEQGWLAFLLFTGAIVLLAFRLALFVRHARDPASAGLAAGGCATLLSFAAAMYGGNYLVGTTGLVAWIAVGLGVSRIVRAPGATGQELGAA